MAKSSSHAKRPSIAPPNRRSVLPPAVSRRAPAAAVPLESAPPVVSRRKFRGAAPWAARHAQKHADEVAQRNQEPPRPGSARATLRTPEQAENIKARVGALHEHLNQLRALKKRLPEQCYAAGQILRAIREQRLFEAKGYASFEAFVEREIDLGSKLLALRLTRIPEIFTEAAAKELGMDALLGAIDTLDRLAKPKTPPKGR
ncbi:MAG: hypothetical protein M3020_23990 [Myxococcota bacterium]|nr:hypothetical protein [Myxococcota bacterium]